jgi:hypothetical protein
VIAVGESQLIHRWNGVAKADVVEQAWKCVRPARHRILTSGFAHMRGALQYNWPRHGFVMQRQFALPP